MENKAIILEKVKEKINEIKEEERIIGRLRVLLNSLGSNNEEEPHEVRKHLLKIKKEIDELIDGGEVLIGDLEWLLEDGKIEYFHVDSPYSSKDETVLKEVEKSGGLRVDIEEFDNSCLYILTEDKIIEKIEELKKKGRVIELPSGKKCALFSFSK